MNSDSPFQTDGPPMDDGDAGEAYSLEIIAEMAGVQADMVLHYQEMGYLRLRSEGGDVVFDAECLLQLRRIEYLRTTCRVNDAGLGIILRLMQELEDLRQERRRLLR